MSSRLAILYLALDSGLKMAGDRSGFWAKYSPTEVGLGDFALKWWDSLISRWLLRSLGFFVCEVSRFDFSDKLPNDRRRMEVFCPRWHEALWHLCLVRSFQHLKTFASPSWWRVTLKFAQFPTAAVSMLMADSSDLQTVRKVTSDTPVIFSDWRYTLRLKPQQNFK